MYILVLYPWNLEIARCILFDAMRYPPEEHYVFHLDIIDSLVDNVHENLLADFPEIVGIRDEFQCSDCDGIHNVCAVCAEIDACLHGLGFENANATVNCEYANSSFAVLVNSGSKIVNSKKFVSGSASFNSAAVIFYYANSDAVSYAVANSNSTGFVFASSDSAHSSYENSAAKNSNFGNFNSSSDNYAAVVKIDSVYRFLISVGLVVKFL